MPSAVTDTEVGIVPVATVAINVFEPVSITPADFELLFVTKTRFPVGLAAAEFGAENPPIVVKRFPEEPCTVTVPSYWFETYTVPFGNTATPLGPEPVGKVLRTLLDAVPMIDTVASYRLAT